MDSKNRYRNNVKMIRAGTPSWQAARDNQLIGLAAKVVGDGTLLLENGHRFVNMCSVSYLGLDEHPAIMEGAIAAIRQEGTLHLPITPIRVHLKLFEQLQMELSELWRAKCFVTLSASAASAGVLPLIASGHLSDGKPPLMVFDKQCHFSMNLIKPICADETEVMTSPHNDVDFIEDLCKKHPRVAYVAEGLYSVGGVAPINELLRLQDKYGLFLYLDDSHSLSTHGATGEGYVRSQFGDELNPLTVIVASLAKGFGGLGGVVMIGPARHKDVVEWFGGPLGWSQAINVPGMGAGLASVKIHRSGELARLQQALRRNVALFDRSLETPQSGDGFHIRLVELGEESRAVQRSKTIMQRGFYTSAVFFPIVPRGRAALRIMIRANNRPEEIHAFAEAVRSVMTEDVPADAAT